MNDHAPAQLDPHIERCRIHSQRRGCYQAQINEASGPGNLAFPLVHAELTEALAPVVEAGLAKLLTPTELRDSQPTLLKSAQHCTPVLLGMVRPYAMMVHAPYSPD
jgi:hypothetical protein